MQLIDRFTQFDSEYCRFKNVDTKLASRADLHALILLNQLCPDTKDILAGAEHDKVFFEVDLDKLNMVATDEQLKDLIRCGVSYDRVLDSLMMYV